MTVLSRLDILLHADTARATQDIRQFSNDTKSTFDSIKTGAISMADKVKSATGMMAGAYTATMAGIGAIVSEQVKLANEVSRLAAISPATTQQMQYWAVSAKKTGIEMDKLSDIFKDTSDKVGEFLSSGSGEMKDFFEKVAPKVGVTAQQFRNLSGPDALQLYYNTLEKANLNQQEMTYYMEAVADEATGLISVLKNNGEELKKWGDIAKESGAIMSDELIANAKDMSNQVDIMQLRWTGFKNELASAVLPQLIALSKELNKTGGVVDTVAKSSSIALSEIAKWMMTDAPHQFAGVVGIVAVGAMAKFGASVIGTIPALTAQGVAMANNARIAIAEATSQTALERAIYVAQRARVIATLTVRNYQIALTELLATTVAYTRALPAKITALRASATAMMTMSTATNIAGRGIVGMGTALGSVASIINRHPLLVLAGVLATVVVGTEGLQGAMQSLGDALGVTGVLFENFAKGAVEGIGFLAKDVMDFFSSFGSGAKDSTKSASNSFGDMFEGTEKGFIGIMQVSASVFDKIGSHVRASTIYIVQQLGNAATAVKNGFIAMGNGITTVFEYIVNMGINRINTLLTGINTLISATNSTAKLFGGDGNTIAPIQLIQNVKFDRTQALSYDKTPYGQTFNETQTTALRTTLDANIAQLKAQKNAAGQATEAMVDLTKTTKNVSQNLAKASDDKKNDKAKAAKAQAKSAKKQSDADLTNFVKLAANDIGVNEHDNAKTIMAYQKAVGYMSRTLDAWCASFVGAKLEQAGFKSTNSASARSYDTYGVAYDKNKIIPSGAIATVARKGGSGRHVFIIDKDLGNGMVSTIEGNAGKHTDRVIHGKRSKSQLVAVRIPVTASGKMASDYGSQILRADELSEKTAEKQAEEAKRLAEQQANARLSIEREYAGKVRQVELKLADDIKKIKDANFGTTDEAKYIEQAKKRAEIDIAEYKATQAEKINSLRDYQNSEEQQIRAKWQKEREAITNNAEYQLAENAVVKEQLLKAIDDKEQYELSQYRITQSQKLSAMTDFNKSELQQIKDRYAYEQLLLQQQPASDDRDIEMAINEAKQAKEIADLQKGHRDNAMSMYDSLTGNSELAQLKTDLDSRQKMLEDAYKNEAITQAQYNAMKLESERAYYEQHRQLRVSQMEGMAGNMTQIMGDLVGKQSKAYRIMFAIEKGFAIARSVMAIQTGIAQAAALPFPANIPAMMSVAAATASIISNIQAVRQPQIDGQAHDGLSYIPREGTYLLDKGERVIKPRDNQRLTQFLDNQPKQANTSNPALNVQIHNNAPVDVTTRQGDNGELIMMIEERVRQSWQRAGGNPNSHEAKMLKQGFNVRPNRG